MKSISSPAAMPRRRPTIENQTQTEAWRSGITRDLCSQALASLDMLLACIESCPAAEWDERHGDYPFSQVAFHALFDIDYHLAASELELKSQHFHAANQDCFAGYGELEEPIPLRLYPRDFIDRYGRHCRERIISVIGAMSLEELTEPDADIRKNMTRLERTVNLIRHSQHHAAQLGLRLQLLSGKEMVWLSRGA